MKITRILLSVLAMGFFPLTANSHEKSGIQLVYTNNILKLIKRKEPFSASAFEILLSLSHFNEALWKRNIDMTGFPQDTDDWTEEQKTDFVAQKIEFAFIELQEMYERCVDHEINHSFQYNPPFEQLQAKLIEKCYRDDSISHYPNQRYFLPAPVDYLWRVIVHLDMNPLYIVSTRLESAVPTILTEIRRHQLRKQQAEGQEEERRRSYREAIKRQLVEKGYLKPPDLTQ